MYNKKKKKKKKKQNVVIQGHLHWQLGFWKQTSITEVISLEKKKPEEKSTKTLP